VSGDVAGKAVALREALRGNETAALSAAERVLLTEWLDRVADTRS
jgi:hypothetical protein